MTFNDRYLSEALVIATLAVSMAIPVAQADDDKVQRLTVSNTKWLAECGACHLAYPSRFLPAESWREIMTGLNEHFGSDASLDDDSVREITAFLVDNARRKKTSLTASGKWPLRISETRWFRREHAEAASRARNNPRVKSMANCSTCHTQADMGDYSERNILIPE